VVDLVLSVREREREAGNYERADELRDELEALGVEVQDTDEGQRTGCRRASEGRRFSGDDRSMADSLK